MAGNYTFVIVGKGDTPLYEAEFVANPKQKEDNAHLNQFIIHAALDVIDELVWTSNQMYFKTVDKFNDLFVSAYVTAGHVKLMVLHDVRNDDGIRNFFADVHELYLKTLLNPFYGVNGRITSPAFDAKVKALGRKHIGAL